MNRDQNDKVLFVKSMLENFAKPHSFRKDNFYFPLSNIDGGQNSSIF